MVGQQVTIAQEGKIVIIIQKESIGLFAISVSKFIIYMYIYIYMYVCVKLNYYV